MPVICRVDNFPVTVGGEPHSGWLPKGAAVPLPTPEHRVALNLSIDFDGSGYLLIVESADNSLWGDTWHQTLSDAQNQALQWYSVPQVAWQSGQPAAG